MKVNGLPGTRDFYPELQRRLNYIFGIWRNVAEKYGYEEMDGPLLESAELWTLKSGNEIPDQMYSFVDKGERNVAIRPELTPSLARMVAAKQRELGKPIKWFGIPRCWRYERPQSGRLREFYQLNVDVLGTDSMRADAEVIMTAIDIMRKLGLTEKDFYIRLCNRRLLESLFLQVVSKEKLKDVSRLIDKKDKLSEGDFEKSLNDLGLDDSAVKKLNNILVMQLEDVDVKKLDEEGLKGYKELKELLTLMAGYDALRYVKVDFTIMRGFDYYTSTVFEVFDNGGKYRAIAGGGRYDNLVKDFGGEECSGVGYGMGDVVLGLFLEEKCKLPVLDKEVDYFIVSIGDVYIEVLQLANKLRKRYLVETDVVGWGLQKQMKYANKIKAKKVLFVGEEELKNKRFKVKDMKSGKEEFISFEDL
ncbi:MAG: histidine--tRNA ligase [archaeon]